MAQQSQFWVCIYKYWTQDLKDLQTHPHWIVFHNSQEVEATWVSIRGWKDDGQMVNTYKGVPFSLERNSVTYPNMEEEFWGCYIKWNNPVVSDQYFLYESPKAGKLLEIQHGTETRRRRIGELFNGYRVSDLQD